MRNIRAICTVILLLSLIGCRKEDTRWDSNLLIPILKAHLGVSNILADSLITKNSDNSLTLVYDKSFYQFNLDTLLQIPDTTIQTSFNIPFGTISAAPGQQIISINQETEYQLGNISLAKITLKDGKINYTIKSHIKGKTLIKFKLPLATFNGVPFEFTTELPAATVSSASTFTSTLDLSGYDIDLRGLNHNRTNTIFTNIDAFISTTGDTTQVTPSDSISFYYTFDNIKPAYGKGYFGNYHYDVPSSIYQFDLFKSISSGSLSIEDISFKLYVKNAVGIDARLKLKEFTSINSRTNNRVELQNGILNNSMNVNRAIENPFTPTVYSTTLNNDNSNIKSLIENLPDKIGYAFDIDINPLGNVTNGNDFIHTDKTFEAGLRMEIPLAVKFNQLVLQDTLTVSVDSGSFSKRYKDGSLTIIADNLFPFSATPAFYILNYLNQVTDSLIGIPGIIEAADLNTTLITQSKHSELTIDLDRDRFLRVIESKKIIVKIVFNTASNARFNKIYSDYGIDIKLTANPKLELNYR